MVITFDGRDIVYDVNELDEIVLSYAMTIHKSQGLEYLAVIIPLMTQHYTMLQKNLVYTAITRGKSLVILVAQKKALAIVVKNNKATRRWSMLEGPLHLLRAKSRFRNQHTMHDYCQLSGNSNSRFFYPFTSFKPHVFNLLFALHLTNKEKAASYSILRHS